jgi:CheY-like chemotaxis protein
VLAETLVAVQSAKSSRAPSRRILLVEDSLFTRSFLASELTAEGYAVDVAESSERALELVRRQKPDVALIDVFLGEGPSGLDLARTLRSDPRTAKTFIVALSGHYAPNWLALAQDAGCDRFLLKPCPPEVIVEMIEHSAPPFAIAK